MSNEKKELLRIILSIILPIVIISIGLLLSSRLADIIFGILFLILALSYFQKKGVLNISICIIFIIVGIIFLIP